MAVVLGRWSTIIITSIQQGQESTLSSSTSQHFLKRTTNFLNNTLIYSRAQTIIDQIRRERSAMKTSNFCEHTR